MESVQCVQAWRGGWKAAPNSDERHREPALRQRPAMRSDSALASDLPSDLPSDLNGPSMDPAGRRQRLARIFQNNHRFVWRLLRRLGVGLDDIEDAVQQVFLITAERIDDVREASESSFVYGTAVRVATNQRRRLARETFRGDLDVDLSPLPSPGELTDQKRAREALDFAVSRMTEELRAAFVLFEIEGFTTPEIAALMGAPLGTVASRLRRARQSFRRLIPSAVAATSRGHA